MLLGSMSSKAPEKGPQELRVSRQEATQGVSATPGLWARPALWLVTRPPLQVSERLSQPGVAIGLAWTPLGGEIMFVEASRMDGEGQLTLTGQLGVVMKESAHLAISWLRSNAKKYHLTNGERRGRGCTCDEPETSGQPWLADGLTLVPWEFSVPPQGCAVLPHGGQSHVLSAALPHRPLALRRSPFPRALFCFAFCHL